MSVALSSTPRADGYRMPAEWALHSGCWMAWPERTDNWRDGAAPAQAAYADVAAAIADCEPVSMTVSAGQMERARALLPESVRVVELPTDDAWMRDIGPTFLIGDGECRGVDWQFNAWGGFDGGLYHPWDRDDVAAERVLAIEGAARYRAQMVLEGGSIHVDGEGTVLVTEECLLNRNRNPHLGRSEIESILCEYLGAEKVIWMGRGLFNDETDGHVDNLCCFVRPGEVALTWCDDPEDPQYDISRARPVPDPPRCAARSQPGPVEQPASGPDDGGSWNRASRLPLPLVPVPRTCGKLCAFAGFGGWVRWRGRVRRGRSRRRR